VAEDARGELGLASCKRSAQLIEINVEKVGATFAGIFIGDLDSVHIIAECNNYVAGIAAEFEERCRGGIEH
jgi:hypothetical protein